MRHKAAYFFVLSLIPIILLLLAMVQYLGPFHGSYSE